MGWLFLLLSRPPFPFHSRVLQIRMPRNEVRDVWRQLFYPAVTILIYVSITQLVD